MMLTWCFDMRTTLTIDDDVAARLKKAAKGRAFKDVTNRALRLGLQAMEARASDSPYATRVVRGQPKFLNLDNVAEAIAETEGDDWR